MKDTLLIVDDEKDLIAGLKRSVTQELECTVLTATNGREALDVLHGNSVCVVLTDISMPEMDGMTLLNKIVALDPSLTIIMMSGYGTIEIAVQALKHGAYDFIQKPFEFDNLITLLKKALERNRLQQENNRMNLRINEQPTWDSLVGESSRMQYVRNRIQTLAKTDVTVLITGETGTGKDVAAGLIHQRSARGKKRMVTVNCPALPEGLLESELFGHKKGAFTGADTEKKGCLTERQEVLFFWMKSGICLFRFRLNC
jgi:DNA-binding NtrC family response regulator